MIYFDNAATSWPKPAGVVQAMTHFLNEVGANPGRAAHRQAVESGRVVFAARQAIASLFHALDPMNVVFCQNITEVLNLRRSTWFCVACWCPATTSSPAA